MKNAAFGDATRIDLIALAHRDLGNRRRVEERRHDLWNKTCRGCITGSGNIKKLVGRRGFAMVGKKTAFFGTRVTWR